MSFHSQSEALELQIQEAAQSIAKVLSETSKKMVGQSHICRRLLMALVAQGHVLLEGLPGLAKTTAIKTLGEAAALEFKRIQFTPDLLPADLIGTQIYDPRSMEFRVKKGPIFAHLVLADEINRAPAKVQSALLEAMEERQITIGSQSFHLEEPFLVMATQNPIEQEGTYPLPEAQVDRFLFKLLITYPTPSEEEVILQRAASLEPMAIQKVIDRQTIRHIRSLSERIYVADKIRRYIVDLTAATRFPANYGLKDLAPLIACGASPRASLALDRLARINALWEGRSFVTPQDIKDLASDILRHRIKATYEAEAEGLRSEEIINRILERVDVP